MHARTPTRPAAGPHEHLGAYIRNGLSKRDADKVEKHLDECRKCTAIYLELTEVNSNLARLARAVLLGAAGARLPRRRKWRRRQGWRGALLRAVRDWVLGDPVGRTVGAGAGVAAAAAVAAGLAPHRRRPGSEGPGRRRACRRGTGRPRSGCSGRPGRASRRQPAAPPPAAAPPADQPADPPADPAPAQTQQAPVISQPLSTVNGQPGGKTVIDLTEGATDANGDPLSVKEATVASPAHGTVTRAARRPRVQGRQRQRRDLRWPADGRRARHHGDLPARHRLAGHRHHRVRPHRRQRRRGRRNRRRGHSQRRPEGRRRRRHGNGHR